MSYLLYREELNLEKTNTSKYTENTENTMSTKITENTENTENTTIHDALPNLYTDTLNPLSNLDKNILDSSVDHSFIDTDTEKETRTINRLV